MSAAEFVDAEIASQPESWRKAAEVAEAEKAKLPAPGERVAVVGCGTSWFIAQAYASRREELGHGETDAFVGSEFPSGRSYDMVIAISRSGTTTEILRLLRRLTGSQRTLAVIGDPQSPGAGIADQTVLLPFADEQSVVQTRFATSVLALLRTGLGEDIRSLAEGCEAVVAEEIPAALLNKSQFTFLGRGFGVGLANEAALKMREAAIAWAESYPAMDYRHGPISITDANSAVFFLGDVPDGLAQEIEAVGGTAHSRPGEDPQLTLVRCQKFAIAVAKGKGLNPDEPRNLTRSIVLEPHDT